MKGTWKKSSQLYWPYAVPSSKLTSCFGNWFGDPRRGVVGGLDLAVQVLRRALGFVLPAEETGDAAGGEAVGELAHVGVLEDLERVAIGGLGRGLEDLLDRPLEIRLRGGDLVRQRPGLDGLTRLDSDRVGPIVIRGQGTTVEYGLVVREQEAVECVGPSLVVAGRGDDEETSFVLLHDLHGKGGRLPQRGVVDDDGARTTELLEPELREAAVLRGDRIVGRALFELLRSPAAAVAGVEVEAAGVHVAHGGEPGRRDAEEPEGAGRRLDGLRLQDEDDVPRLVARLPLAPGVRDLDGLAVGHALLRPRTVEVGRPRHADLEVLRRLFVFGLGCLLGRLACVPLLDLGRPLVEPGLVLVDGFAELEERHRPRGLDGFRVTHHHRFGGGSIVLDRELRPEKIESPTGPHEEHRLGVDVEVHLFPGGPHIVLAAAVEPLAGLAARSGDHVVRPGLAVVPEAHRLQTRDLVEAGEVLLQRAFGRRIRDLAGGEVRQELLEQGSHVVAEIGLQPVLRPQEDLSVGLPHPVCFPPLPLLGGRGWELDLSVESEEGALHEHLEGVRGLDDTAGHQTGARVHVDEVEAVEIVA